MSAVALPTKSCGSRPPLPPSIATTFGPFGNDGPEPIHKLIVDDVRMIIKHSAAVAPESAETVRELLLARRRMVERELYFERLLASEPLPPLLTNLYSLDLLGKEEGPAPIYVRLLGEIDYAIENLDERIFALNSAAPASDS